MSDKTLTTKITLPNSMGSSNMMNNMPLGNSKTLKWLLYIGMGICILILISITSKVLFGSSDEIIDADEKEKEEEKKKEEKEKNDKDSNGKNSLDLNILPGLLNEKCNTNCKNITNCWPPPHNKLPLSPVSPSVKLKNKIELNHQKPFQQAVQEALVVGE